MRDRTDCEDGGVLALGRDEGRQMLAERVRDMLGMSLEQFERDYDAGRLPDSPKAEHLAMLLPFAR